MGKHKKAISVDELLDLQRPCLAICDDKHCAKAGAKQLYRAACAALAELGLDETVAVELTECQDNCDEAPSVTVLPDDYAYVEIGPQELRQIVAEHVRDHMPIPQLMQKRSRKRFKKATEPR